jgi:hypothetical protein
MTPQELAELLKEETIIYMAFTPRPQSKRLLLMYFLPSYELCSIEIVQLESGDYEVKNTHGSDVFTKVGDVLSVNQLLGAIDSLEECDG